MRTEGSIEVAYDQVFGGKLDQGWKAFGLDNHEWHEEGSGSAMKRSRGTSVRLYEASEVMAFLETERVQRLEVRMYIDLVGRVVFRQIHGNVDICSTFTPGLSRT